MENENLLFSRMVKTSSRRYFFDVYEKLSGRLLRIRESRFVEGVSRQQTLYIWEGDLQAFLDALNIILHQMSE